MTLSDFPVRASIGVTDIQRAARFYEGVLGLVCERSNSAPVKVDATAGVEPATQPVMSRCPGPPGSPR